MIEPKKDKKYIPPFAESIPFGETGPLAGISKWSSHPRALSAQRRALFLAGLVPLFVLAVVAAFSICGFDGFLSVLRHWKLATTAAATAFCMSLGAIFTMVMLNMVGRAFSRHGAPEGRDSLPFPWWLIGVVSFFWLIPWLLSMMAGSWIARTMPQSFAKIQFLLNLLCFLPFLCLLFWTWYAETRGRFLEMEKEAREKGGRLGHPRWLAVLGHLFLLLFLFSFLVDFHAWLERWAATSPEFAKLAPSLRHLGNGAIRLVLFGSLVPLSMICYVLWKLRWCIVLPKKEETSGDESGKNGDEEGAERKRPEIAARIRSILPPGARLDGDVEWVKVPNTVGILAGDEQAPMRLLMGGVWPTVDQWKFFCRFNAAHAEMLSKQVEEMDPRTEVLRADMIVHGPDGSGRTEALLAAALHSAVVRGQKVLFLVPETDCAKVLVRRAEKRIRELLLFPYISAGQLTPIVAASWLGRENSEPPNLLFSTPEHLEKCFFANPDTVDASKRQRLREIILSYSVVFVDDLLEYPLTVRSHLVFLIDKLRLLLAGEFILSQVVVSTSPIHSPHGVESLGKRLFGLGRFNRNDNVFAMRPRKCDPYWFGTIRVQRSVSLEDVSRKIVSECATASDTILYRKGVGRMECQRLEAELRTGLVDPTRVSVVSRLYDLEDRAAPEAIFYLSLTCGNAAASLRLNLARGPEGSDTVFFRIAGDDELDEEERPVFPILPDESALALRARHLQSVLPFMERFVPIEARTWSHFGISVTHPALHEAEQLPETGSRFAVQWRHDSLVDEVRYGDGTIWPYLVLVSGGGMNSRGRPVDFGTLPNDRESIWRKKPETERADDVLLLADSGASEVSPGEKPKSQLACWKDDRGDSLGEMDLAHASELILERDGDSYAASGFGSVPEAETNRYAMVLNAEYYRGTDIDYVIPVREFSWVVPYGGLRVEDIQSDGAMATFPLDRRGEQMFRVEASIQGRMNYRGSARRHVGRPFGFDAYLSCLVLLPDPEIGGEEASSDGEMARKLVRNCLDGTWRTDSGEGFSPAMTHALSAALGRAMKGWPFFATVLAFDIDGRGDSVGRYVIWIVEPTNSGRSAFPSLVSLLQQDAEFRKSLFKEALEILRSAKTIEDFRVASRSAFVGESFSPEDVASALDTLAALFDESRLGDLRERRAARKERLRQEKETERRRREEEFRRREEASRRREEEKRRREEAEKKRVQEDVSVPLPPLPPLPDPEPIDPDVADFDRVVVDAIQKFSSSVDVSHFARDLGWSSSRIADSFQDVLWNHPELFYVSKYRLKHQTWSDGEGRVSRFVVRNLTYAFPKEELELRRQELESVAATMMEGIAEESDLVRKALLLHDRMIRTCDYDVEAADNDDDSPTARTAYSVLVRHKAVCEGYTMAYRYLLDLAGIRSEEIISEAMEHCWNYVLLDGHWFHVDVTWDDPVGSGGMPDDDLISRKYFLLSDAGIRRVEHHSWSTRGLPPADDTRYDSAKWDDIP